MSFDFVFKTVPEIKLSTNYQSPTVLKISSDEDKFVVGFKDGSVRVFSITGA
jgi:hypothetical protein